MTKGRVSSQLLTTASETAPLPSEPKRLFDGFVDYVQMVSKLTGWMLIHRICVLSVLAWAPSTVIAYLVHVLLPAQSGPDIFSDVLQFFIGAIVVAPLMETLAMRYIFLILRKFAKSHIALATLSAVFWIPFHAMYAGWGVHAAWPFFILSLCYLSLEPRSVWRAIGVTALVHAMCNALSYGLFLVLRFLALA